MKQLYLFTIILCLFTKIIIAQNWQWAQTIPSIQTSECNDIAKDDNGNFYVTGAFQKATSFGSIQLSTLNYNDTFVAKINSNGNWDWVQKAIGDDNDNQGRSIHTDSNGYSYVLGDYENDIDIGSASFFSNNPSCYIAKINPNGQWIWANNIRAGNNGFAFATDVISDTSGYSYITGRYVGTIYFGTSSPITLSHPNSGNGNPYKIFVAKVNPNGSFAWVRDAGGEDSFSTINVAHGITLDNIGNIYLTGVAGINPVFGSHTITVSENTIFAAKMDTNGNFIWATGSESMDNYNGFGNSIIVDENGNTYIGGEFRGTVTIGSETLNGLSASRHAFIAKIDNTGQWVWAKMMKDFTDGGSDYVSKLQFDDQGNIAFLGAFSNQLTFGSTVINSSNFHDIFFGKIDVNGNWLYATAAGGGSNILSPNSFAFNQTNETLVVVGSYSDDIQLDSFQFTASATSIEGFLGAFNTNLLSIDDYNSNLMVNIHPNPSSDFIRMSGLNNPKNYTIYNILGKEISQGYVDQNTVIDIRNYANGLYFIHFENKAIKKFIKK